MEECLDALYCAIIGIKYICVGLRGFHKLIGVSVLNILLDLIHLEVHCHLV